MAVLDLAQLTWEEVRDLDRAKAVAILPVGAIEAHGPHLPLATDVVIAEAMAREGARRLAARGLAAVVLPALAYSTAAFAAAFAGTTSTRPETARALVLGVARADAQALRQGRAAYEEGGGPLADVGQHGTAGGEGGRRRQAVLGDIDEEPRLAEMPEGARSRGGARS